MQNTTNIPLILSASVHSLITGRWGWKYLWQLLETRTILKTNKTSWHHKHNVGWKFGLGYPPKLNELWFHSKVSLLRLPSPLLPPAPAPLNNPYAECAYHEKGQTLTLYTPLNNYFMQMGGDIGMFNVKLKNSLYYWIPYFWCKI